MISRLTLKSESSLGRYNFITLSPCLIAFGLLVFSAGHSLAQTDKKYTDGYYRDRDNQNETLVVFVAGLAGEASWRDFTRLMDSDNDFDRIDYFVYHSPQSLDIEENVRGIKSRLREIGGRYGKIVYVGHSIGGIIIKRWLLLEANAGTKEQNLPNLVITFGTPLDTDKFSVSMFKRLGARVFWPAVSNLQREVFNIDRVAEINKAWRTATKQSPLNEVKRVTVFGVEDEIAPAANESRSETTFFIRGNHLDIISPDTDRACSWIVIKAVLLNRTSSLYTNPCVLK